jgi:GNAT superfamily N-acetyltransferase
MPLLASPSPLEVRRDDGYFVSTDTARLDPAFIHRYLSQDSYWAQGRSRDVQDRAIANSLNFGLYYGAEPAGFARVVTDYATFGWLCDLFVAERHRGKGLGKWLVQTVVAHPDLAAIRRLMLATRDAHELYRSYGGFEPLASPERWMTRTQA